MAPVLITRQGGGSVPFTYTLSQSQDFVPSTVTAKFDGTNASGTFLACVSFYAPDGTLLARCPTGQSLAVGDIAEVTYAPFLRGGGGGTAQTFKGARIQATNTQGVLTSTNTNLVYQSVLFDTDGMANLAADNRILTVNTSGLYLVVCCTQWAFNTAGRRINVVVHNDFYTNGAIPVVDSQADNRNAIWTGSGRSSNTSVGVYSAVSGDFFASGAFQGSGSTINANGFANCFLAAILIGLT